MDHLSNNPVHKQLTLTLFPKFYCHTIRIILKNITDILEDVETLSKQLFKYSASNGIIFLKTFIFILILFTFSNQEKTKNIFYNINTSHTSF